MDTVIKLKPEELTDEFIGQLRQLASYSKRIEIRLDGVDATNGLSQAQIEDRLQQVADNMTVSFSMDEFQEYVHKIAG